MTGSRNIAKLNCHRAPSKKYCKIVRIIEKKSEERKMFSFFLNNNRYTVTPMDIILKISRGLI